MASKNLKFVRDWHQLLINRPLTRSCWSIGGSPWPWWPEQYPPVQRTPRRSIPSLRRTRCRCSPTSRRSSSRSWSTAAPDRPGSSRCFFTLHLSGLFDFLLCSFKPVIAPGSTAKVNSISIQVRWHQTIVDQPVLIFPFPSHARGEKKTFGKS